MERTASRNFTVEYFEKAEKVWVVSTQLKDDAHDIEMEIEIEMESMTVLEARIGFNRFPVAHCPLIEKKASLLKGLKVDGDFTRNAMKVFMGPEGCPNILSLLNISVPGILYYFYPWMIRSGKMKPEVFDGIIRGELKNACLAHSML